MATIKVTILKYFSISTIEFSIEFTIESTLNYSSNWITTNLDVNLIDYWFQSN